MIKKIFLIFIFFSLAAAFIAPARAQDTSAIEITPGIIDTQANPRDKLEYILTLKNNGERGVTMYPLVYDIDMTDSHKIFSAPEKLDKATSIARWTSIKRGAVDLDPGAEVTLALTIEVNLSAKPGKYYAGISFSPGSNITMAGDNFNASPQPTVTINIEVKDQTVELLEKQDFSAERNIFFRFPVIFDVNVSNAGNVDTVPTGNIYVFNRKNQEVAEIPFNSEQRAVVPGAKEVLTAAWNGKGLGVGKFKATLEGQYGVNGARDLQGTAYFWVLPWYLVVILGGGLLLAATLLTVIIFRRTYHGHPGASHLLPYTNHEPVVDLKKKN